MSVNILTNPELNDKHLVGLSEMINKHCDPEVIMRYKERNFVISCASISPQPAETIHDGQSSWKKFLNNNIW